MTDSAVKLGQRARVARPSSAHHAQPGRVPQGSLAHPLDAPVQARRRLIEEDQAGVRDELVPNGGALALAARQAALERAPDLQGVRARA